MLYRKVEKERKFSEKDILTDVSNVLELRFLIF